MKYKAMPDLSVGVFHKNHFIRIWLDKIEVDEVPININFDKNESYENIVVRAVNYFEKEILKNDNVA